jgi:hypothetical protein
MIVKCPRCGSETSFEGNPYRPFCSERCKEVDLGKWVTGAYRLPTKVQEEEEDGSPPPEKGPSAE